MKTQIGRPAFDAGSGIRAEHLVCSSPKNWFADALRLRPVDGCSAAPPPDVRDLQPLVAAIPDLQARLRTELRSRPSGAALVLRARARQVDVELGYGLLNVTVLGSRSYSQLPKK